MRDYFSVTSLKALIGLQWRRSIQQLLSVEQSPHKIILLPVYNFDSHECTNCYQYRLFKHKD